MARTDYGSHAYWRMQGYQDNGTSAGYIALSAMLFRDETGSSIAATGGTAIESGHSSTFVVANLFDGIDASFWESAGQANSWAGYQFAAAKKVMQIALQITASMDSSGPPPFVSFEYSDDGVVWAQAGWAHTGTMTNDTPKWFDLAGSVAQ